MNPIPTRSAALHAGPAFNIQPKQPPQTQGILTILNWVDWGVFAVCLAGFLIAVGMMAIRHHRGGGMEEMGGLGKACIATVLAAAATGIVGALSG